MKLFTLELFGSSGREGGLSGRWSGGGGGGGGLTSQNYNIKV